MMNAGGNAGEKEGPMRMRGGCVPCPVSHFILLLVSRIFYFLLQWSVSARVRVHYSLLPRPLLLHESYFHISTEY